MFKLIVTGRCNSYDYTPISEKILSVVPKNEPVLMVLSGPMTSLNEICTAISGYKSWQIDRDLSTIGKSSSIRMKNMAEKEADLWLVFGRNVGSNGGGAAYWAGRFMTQLDICDLNLA